MGYCIGFNYMGIFPLCSFNIIQYRFRVCSSDCEAKITIAGGIIPRINCR